MHRRSISGAIAERLQATDEASLARGSQAQPSSSEKPPASPFARAAAGEGAMPGDPRQPGGAGTASAAVTQEDVHRRVVNDFQRALKESKDMAVAVAAIKALTGVIQDSTAKTLMGVGKELKLAARALQRFQPTSISLQAACELFQCYTARQPDLGMEDFETSRAKLIQSGEQFAQISYRARQRIADIGARHIREGSTIMVHGYSRCVVAILQRAVAMGSKFSAVVTEGRPDESGLKMAKELANISMPVSVVLDSAAACMLERVDMVLVGAEGVVESGGIINKLGTYQIALCARSCNIPFYVAAESYKFARYFPLNQADVPTDLQAVDFGPLLPAGVTVVNPSRDYTPPAYITLLVTDLGMLTPAAVSDELIQLYA